MIPPAGKGDCADRFVFEGPQSRGFEALNEGRRYRSRTGDSIYPKIWPAGCSGTDRVGKDAKLQGHFDGWNAVPHA